MNRYLRILAIVCAFCFFSVEVLEAEQQLADSLLVERNQTVNPGNNIAPVKSDTVSLGYWKPNSKYSILFGLIPGGGQIYNRKYWKLPIVYGAFTACTYALIWNTKTYNEYRNAYRDFLSEDPSKNTAWLDFAPPGTKPEDYAKYGHLKEPLKRGNDTFRRYRDLSIIVTAGVYLLSILDAYVDAELYEFDITPDLTMRIAPDVQMSNQPMQIPQLGVSCSLLF